MEIVEIMLMDIMVMEFELMGIDLNEHDLMISMGIKLMEIVYLQCLALSSWHPAPDSRLLALIDHQRPCHSIHSVRPI